jgi:hypothetical protein
VETLTTLTVPHLSQSGVVREMVAICLTLNLFQLYTRARHSVSIVCNQTRRGSQLT